MTYRRVSPNLLLASYWPSRFHPQHAGGSPSTPALLLLVIKRLILLVVRLNERIISSIGKGEAISIAEVAIDRRHLTFPLDVRLLSHLSGRARGFLIQCPRSCQPLKFIDQFFLSHLASFLSTLVLASC